MLSLSATVFRFCKAANILKPSSISLIRGLTSIDSSSLDNRSKCFRLAKLDHRGFIVCSGADAEDYLQNLLTNDVGHLRKPETSCLYAFLLNDLGRIMVDMFVYRLPQTNSTDDAVDDEFLIEVDRAVVPNLVKLLKRYKIRRKVSISTKNDCHSFALFPNEGMHSDLIDLNQLKTPSSNDIELKKFAELFSNSPNMLLTPDPRNSIFGFRIVNFDQEHDLDDGDEHRSLISDLKSSPNKINRENFEINSVSSAEYRSFRYWHGFGEGVTDFPPESSFPFDANAELLNGICFQKGCYIGQELVARIYHTGVIRKRMMPIEILESNKNGDESSPLLSSQQLPAQNIINQEDGKVMGRFRANFERKGLAVLKFQQILSNSSPLCLNTSGLSIKTWRPSWWPDTIE